MNFLIGYEDVISELELPEDTFSYYSGIFHEQESQWDEIFAVYNLMEIIAAHMDVADKIFVNTGDYDLDFFRSAFSTGYGSFLTNEVLMAVIVYPEKLVDCPAVIWAKNAVEKDPSYYYDRFIDIVAEKINAERVADLEYILSGYIEQKNSGLTLRTEMLY